MTLPPPFEEQMRRELGPEFEAFAAALEQPPPVSIRLNPVKPIPLPDHDGLVPWCAEGLYLAERPVFTLDPLFHAGAYYVQEASSMFVAQAVRQLVPAHRPLRALDLAAAPGGKSTLLASVLPAGSLLLANEVIRSRYRTLEENLIRWGYVSTHTANHDPRDFAALAGFFDLVLIDAPCSGEGLFRKDPAAMAEWSEDAVTRCAARQQRILHDALPLVAPGGVLIYSTCTYNERENEGNAAAIASHQDFERAALQIPPAWGIVTKSWGYQFYPQRLRGEGFYLAAFRRADDGDSAAPRNSRPFRNLTPLPRRHREQLAGWLQAPEELTFYLKPGGTILALPATHLDDAQVLSTHLGRLRLGTDMGVFKGNDFVPDHALGLSAHARRDLPAVELSLEQALQFLKRETPHLTAIPRGWALARFRGHNLGWMKGLKNRINNYLPKEWRIRMDI